MIIHILSQREIAIMMKACQVVARTHEHLVQFIKPGISTLEINEIANDFIRSHNAIPSFQGYNGYPAAICISVNEEVIHGIPSERKLIDGDIVSLDIGAFLEGFHGDAARTWPVGNISENDKKLIEVTERAFFKGVEQAKDGNYIKDIANAISRHVADNGFSVVEEYVGHGIGTEIHQSPTVPNYEMSRRGARLEERMTLAIEPMVNAGVKDVSVLEDDWTVVTDDKQNSAHYENTIAVTKNEAIIMTI